MIRRGEGDEDYALCVEIYNALNPAAPIDLAAFGTRPVVVLHGREGYALVKESGLEGCAITMVRVRPESRCRGIAAALLAAASIEARALDKVALFGHVKGADD